MHILYVEDDSLSREVMEIIVKYDLQMDYTVFADSTDFETRLLALDSIPDIIFLDIHVQPLTGFEMLAVIRQHEQFKNVPIIALTASVMNEEIMLLRESGFTGAIAKPVDQELFPQLIPRILAGENIWQIISG